ncbi:MAG: GNAT family N-acetyltransferase [Candidatus Hermodarchaeia archaeon]|jgi:ribosomal protein S18 acetylase RimI-like enzyme
MNIRIIASTETEMATYSDQFLGLKTIFEQAEFPYWILVKDQTVLGLIVAAKEPRELLQPASSTFIQIYLFRHEPDAVARLLSEAEIIATNQQATYLSCIISADKQDTIQSLEKANFSVYDETLKMGVPLQDVAPPQTALTFTRTSPDETNLVLNNLETMMSNTPDRLLHTVVYNIRQLPPDKLESTLSQMEVILVKDQANTVGVISLEGPTIGMLGVHPNLRGQGYGRQMTQWAKSHLAEQGHFRAWLRVSVANEPAKHIFETEGFKASEQMKHYIKTNPNLWHTIPE